MQGQQEGEEAPAFQMERDQAPETASQREERIAAELETRLTELQNLAQAGFKFLKGLSAQN